jgi:hypothetical protein
MPVRTNESARQRRGRRSLGGHAACLGRVRTIHRIGQHLSDSLRWRPSEPPAQRSVLGLAVEHLLDGSSGAIRLGPGRHHCIDETGAQHQSREPHRRWARTDLRPSVRSQRQAVRNPRQLRSPAWCTPHVAGLNPPSPSDPEEQSRVHGCRVIRQAPPRRRPKQRAVHEQEQLDNNELTVPGPHRPKGRWS